MLKGRSDMYNGWEVINERNIDTMERGKDEGKNRHLNPSETGS